jgi:hypothetical protein
MKEPTRLSFNKKTDQTHQEGTRPWWIKNIFIGSVSTLFLIFGIENLIGSYRSNNPMEFIMYFFSSSLIVLISLVGIIYSALRIHAYFKNT